MYAYVRYEQFIIMQWFLKIIKLFIIWEEKRDFFNQVTSMYFDVDLYLNIRVFCSLIRTMSATKFIDAWIIILS